VTEQPDATEHLDRRLEAVLHAYLQAVDAGQQPDREVLLRRHPDLAEELIAFFADQDRVERLARQMRPEEPSPPTAPGEADSPNTVRYFGDYELLQEIGRGGMGVVHRARQVSLNRAVALKMILSGRFASAADLQRFRVEAEAAASLDHPNIVPIYEVGEHRGQHYFTMKLIEGVSLSQELARRAALPAEESQGSSLRLWAGVMATVARAVHHAHQRGILHRDLKPANILLAPLCPDGFEPHVTDFGLAKRMASPEHQAGETLTQSGAIVGTPAYMAPEQASGRKGLTTAADVYGLGAILYECLTGRPPFRAESPLDTVVQVLHDEVVRPRALAPHVPRDLETVCLKCLEKDPSRRYGSAEALAEDLERWLAGKPIGARPAGPVRRTWTWVRQRPWVISTVVGLLLLFTGCLAYALWAQARQMESSALYQQARATRLLLLEAPPGDQRDELLEENRQRLSKAARAARPYPTAPLYEEALALLQVEGRAARRLPLPPTTAGKVERLVPSVFPQSWQFAQVSGDGKLMLVTSRPEVLVLAAETGKIVYAAKAGTAALDPRGHLLALTIPRTADSVRLVRLSDGKEVASIPWSASDITELVFSPDGKRLAVSGGQVDVWDVRRKKWLMPGASGKQSSQGLSFSGDGRRLVSCFGKRGVVWEVERGREVTSFETSSPTWRVTLSPDGRRVACAESLSGDSMVAEIHSHWKAGKPVQVIDLEGTDREMQLRWPTLGRPWYAWQYYSDGFIRPNGPLAFSPDGRFLAALATGDSNRNSVLLWEAQSGREYLRLPGAHFAGFADDGTLYMVRHPSEGDGLQARLDLWKPELVRAALPEEALPLLQAPDSYGKLRHSGLMPFVGLLFAGLAALGALARAALGGYDVEGGWKGTASFACMTVPGLLLVGLGFYYVLTIFDIPGWSDSGWFELIISALFGGLGIIYGVRMLGEELWAYHREVSGDRPGL
jgi:tRNA A-37 threonylcarbamoyl transferase component Bud32